MIFQLKRVIITTLFALTLADVFAKDINLERGTISGKITFANDVPVVDAVINILSIQQYAITNERGNFILKDIPYEKHTLAITSFEAEPKEVLITFGSAKQELAIELIEREAINIEEVVVVAKSEARSIKDNGFSTTKCRYT